MISEIKIGAQKLSDGATGVASGDRTGAIRTAPGRAKYAEATSRGAVFNASTAVAGIAPGTAFGTANNHTLLWNPPRSGKNLELIACSVGYVSGTLGAGFMAYGQVVTGTAGTQTAPSAGTERTPRSTRLGLTTGGVGRFYEDATVTTAPTILRPVFNMGAFLATTALLPGVIKDQLDGEFAVGPGSSLVVHGIAAAGATPLVVVGLTWQETDE